MGSFNREGGRSSGGGFGRGFSGGKSFGGKSFGGGRPAMHQATCSECGNDCEIPFKPTNGRPVFCSNCFAKQNGDAGGSSRPTSFRSERSERPRFEDRQMNDAVCDKCGKDCQVPFRPTAGKPVFCSDCFEKTGDRGGNDRGGERRSRDNGAGSSDVMEQIKMLNTKMDKLISILAPSDFVKTTPDKEIKKEKSTFAKASADKKEKVAPKKVTAKKKK